MFYQPHHPTCFTDGYFAFQKSNKKCSLMVIEQAHNHNNAVIKGMGGLHWYLVKMMNLG